MNHFVRAFLLGALLPLLCPALTQAQPADTVVVWGGKDSSLRTVAQGLTNITAMAAGHRHNVAVKSDGTVVAWGFNQYGQATVPVGLSDVKAVAAGEIHSMALKNDGTVVAWGKSGSAAIVVPEGLTDVVAIAAGREISLALKEDGTVVRWGSFSSTPFGTSPSTWSDIIAIAAGGDHYVGLKADGSVVLWGTDLFSGMFNVPAGLSGATAIATGYGHVVVLKSDGTVVSWGSPSSVSATSVPEGLSGVTAIAAGAMHTIAMKSDGTAVAWGWNEDNQTTVPEDLSGVVAIAGGAYHTMALKVTPIMALSGDLAFGNVQVGQSATRTLTLQNPSDSAVNVAAVNYPAGFSGDWSSGSVAPGGDQEVTVTFTPTAEQNYGGKVTVTTDGTGTSLRMISGTSMPLLTPGSLSVPVAGGNYSFEVTASGDWEWSQSAGSFWVAITEATSQSGSQTFSYSVEANPSLTPRSATITLDSGAPTSTHFRITQAGGQGSAGTVVVWGSNMYDQMTVPTGLSGVTAVASGGYHIAALKSDGTVVAWGHNQYGKATVPEGLSGVTAIAAGVDHTVALKSDGTVVAWGGNGAGQTTVSPHLRGVVAIAAGAYHTVALKSDGTVVAWGKKDNGQVEVTKGMSGVIAIAASFDRTMALKSDGTVVGGGDVPEGVSDVIAIAAGTSYLVALKSDGTVVAWGNNDDGQTTVPHDLIGVSAIAGGWAYTAALKRDGTVAAWGSNGNGQTTVPQGLNGVIAISAGHYHMVALKGERMLSISPMSRSVPATGGSYSFDITASGNWRYSPSMVGPWITTSEAWNQIGNQTFSYTVAANPGVKPRRAKMTLISGDLTVTHYITQAGSSGTVAAWGHELGSGPGGPGGDDSTTVPAGLSGVTAIAAGDGHTVALKSDGTVVAWGSDYQGQTSVPDGLSGVVAIAAGGMHTAALKGDGTVVAWGSNTDLQTAVPPDLTGVTAIAAGFTHTVALKSNGTVVAWGGNSEGQTAVPVGLSGVIAIAAGGEHTVALKNNGAVVAWGRNNRGQTTVPVGLGAAIAIAAGSAHTVAVKSNGTVMAWGFNEDGQTKVPTGLSSVTAVAAGGFHSVALKSNGTVVVWGASSAGQRNAPAGLKNVIAVAAGAVHTVALVLSPAEFNLSRQVPETMTATPDKAGTVAVKFTPAGGASKLVDGSSSILPGTFVTLTATAKVGYLFSHWNGRPLAGQEAGSTLTFAMPPGAIPDLTAVFVANPFLSAPFKALGAKPVFQGLLRPEEGTPASNVTAGLLTATLTPAQGSLSGKVSMDGKVTSYTGLMRGDGSVWFKVGSVLKLSLPLSDGQAGGKSLTASWSVTGLQATVDGPVGNSSGLAQPPLYSKTQLIAADSGLLDGKGKQGYFTVALLPPLADSPEEAATYPQGAGYSGLTLTNNGTLKLTGVLADGTKITASSFVVAGDESAVFVPLPTPGGKTKDSSVLGVLKFDSSQPNSDVTSADLQWFGAVAETKLTVAQTYRAGWPAGLPLETIGALYDGTQTVQDTLGLGAVIAEGNAALEMTDGKLSGPVAASVNINASKVEKLDVKDKSFTLALIAKTGLMSGTFDPSSHWTQPNKSLPKFQGVLLQKGTHQGGHGFFISNRLNDTEPESGRVTLGRP